MNQRLLYFLLSGFGCIAPNIGKYAVQLLRFGKITENTPASASGIILGALLLFVIGGIFVAFVMKPSDEKDAIYKGIAIPALLLSLASGAMPTEKTMNVTSVQEQTQAPAQDKKNTIGGFLNILSPAAAYAAEVNAGQTPTTKKQVIQGTLNFNIEQKNLGDVHVKLKNKNTNQVFSLKPNTSNFSVTNEPGTYKAIIESGEYYKETDVTIQSNKVGTVDVTLGSKSITQKVSDGLTNLIKR